MTSETCKDDVKDGARDDVKSDAKASSNSASILNLSILVPLLVTTIIATGGWYAAHHLTAIRDRDNKLIDLRIQYELGIYRRLERTVGKQITREIADEIEMALADLQVIGSVAQVQMANQYIEEFSGRRLDGISVKDILEDIRRTLRQDLWLEPVTEPVRHFRLTIAPPRSGAVEGAK